MKKAIFSPWMMSIIVLVVLVIYGNLSAIGVAITVFSSVIFFYFEVNTARRCSKDAMHLIPQGNRLPLYILDLGLMTTYVLSTPFKIGVTTDVYYALLWSISMASIFINSIKYLGGAYNWVTTKSVGSGTLYSVHNDATKKILIEFYQFVTLIVTCLVVVSFFGRFELTPILIIINQLYVTFAPKK